MKKLLGAAVLWILAIIIAFFVTMSAIKTIEILNRPTKPSKQHHYDLYVGEKVVECENLPESYIKLNSYSHYPEIYVKFSRKNYTGTNLTLVESELTNEKHKSNVAHHRQQSGLSPDRKAVD